MVVEGDEQLARLQLLVPCDDDLLEETEELGGAEYAPLAMSTIARDINDPKSGLASSSHTANLLGPVLGCIEPDIGARARMAPSLWRTAHSIGAWYSLWAD